MLHREEEWLLLEKYGGEKSEAFFADRLRLTQGEPLAYLIGWIRFLNCKIYLDSKPLIPRTETEYWTEAAIDTIAKYSKMEFHSNIHTEIKILDLCAGSGCIGVAVAKALPFTAVDFAEIEEVHLFTIKRNLQENGIDQNRTSILHSNLFSNITKRYEFIFSNPPYIDEALNRTDDSVKVHEPSRALYGGIEGLEIISNIILQAPTFLTPGGQLWIEHEPEQSASIQTLGSANGFTVTTHNDQYAVERYSVLVLQ